MILSRFHHLPDLIILVHHLSDLIILFIHWLSALIKSFLPIISFPVSLSDPLSDLINDLGQ